MFGPSQFATLFPLVTQPVGGKLHFAGEATSVHHAYVPFINDWIGMQLLVFVAGL